MPRSTTLEERFGTREVLVDEPLPHLNHEGAIVAISFTEAAWAAVDASRKTERDGQRSVVTTCPVRGVVSVDAFVTPAFAPTLPKPWSRVQRAGYAFFADAA